MPYARKRKIILDEGDIKIWENVDEIILKYLNEHKDCTFGSIFSHVNSELTEDTKYSRKGFSLRLDNFIDRGSIRRRPHKQGHYFYNITKKGTKDIGMITLASRFFAKGLLRTNFRNDSSENTKEHFLERIINRIGVYMLFSCIEGILEVTSPKNSHEENINYMKRWLSGINPGIELSQYLSEVSSIFVKFKNTEEAFSSVFNDKNRLKVLKEFQDLIKKKHPDEHKFLSYWSKESERLAKDQKELKKKSRYAKHINELEYNYKL